MLALDTETAKPTNSEPIPRLVSVSISDGSRTSLHAAHEPDLEARVRHVLSGPVALHNAPFDIFALLRWRPSLLDLVVNTYEEGKIIDTQTREKMITTALGSRFGGVKFDLGAVAERRAGLELDKNDPWRTRYVELLGVEVCDWPVEAQRYAMLDSFATWWIAYYQLRDFAKLLTDAPAQARGHLALYAQTLRGIMTDPEQVQRLRETRDRLFWACQHWLLAEGLARWGGSKKKPKVTRHEKAAKERAAVEFPTIDQTPKSGPSLSEDSLGKLNLPDKCQACAGVGCPTCHQTGLGHILQAYATIGSTKWAKVEKLARPIVRPRYDELKVTGRTGCSGPQGSTKIEKLAPEDWVGDNLQNLPREGGFRECLRARPGRKLVISDWGQIELVTWAQTQVDLFGQSRLAEAFRRGEDPHVLMGAKILRIAPATFDKKNNPEHKNARQLAKAPNFGFPGGLGPRRFVDFARTQYGMTVTEYEARKLKADWRETWEPEQYFAWVESLKGHDGRHYVTLPRTGLTRGGCSYNEACNFPFQGLAAACAKRALWMLWRAGLDPASPLFGSWQILFVHDENVTEAPEDRVEEIAREQERIMIEAVRFFCPDVPITVETQILDRYTK